MKKVLAALAALTMGVLAGLVICTQASAVCNGATLGEYQDIEVRNFNTLDAGWLRSHVWDHFGLAPSRQLTNTGPISDPSDGREDQWFGDDTCGAYGFNIMYRQFTETGDPRANVWRVTKKCVIDRTGPSETTSCTTN